LFVAVQNEGYIAVVQIEASQNYLNMDMCEFGFVHQRQLKNSNFTIYE
jgi:hypothetical protein